MEAAATGLGYISMKLQGYWHICVHLLADRTTVARFAVILLVGRHPIVIRPFIIRRLLHEDVLTSKTSLGIFVLTCGLQCSCTHCRSLDHQ